VLPSDKRNVASKRSFPRLLAKACPEVDQTAVPP
jgi:hypothetical protein